MHDTWTETAPSLTAAADVVRAYGHHAGGVWFAGVTIDDPHPGLTVYRVPNYGFDAQVRTLTSADFPVTFVESPHSRHELQMARQRVWDLESLLQVQAVVIPPNGTMLAVVVTGSEAVAQHLLDEVMPGMAFARSASALKD